MKTYPKEYLVEGERWITANGGTEVPSTTRTGREVLYVWGAPSGHHRYLDLGAHRILPRAFDPALDGTPDDPTLTRPFTAHFIVNPVKHKITALLRAQPDVTGRIQFWHSEIDCTKVTLLPATFLNEDRSVYEQESQADFYALRLARSAVYSTKLEVHWRDDAVRIANHVVRTHRAYDRTELRVDYPAFEAIHNLATHSGGDPSNLFHVMDLLRNQRMLPQSAYGW